ncbi:MAG: hypothetical protein L0I76_05350 [Pseudonocardia sp.]|nr:hypothetical protein [Pseudonocardia sp.]
MKRMVGRLSGHGPAEDVEPNPKLANARATGGTRSESGDAASTTGTGATGEYVGQIAGHDEGSAGETGAEARAERNGKRTERPG